MKLTALAGAAAVALALALPQPAQARDGGAVAAGVVGGLAAGAIIGSTMQPRPYTYYGGPAYYAAPYEPTYGRCYRTREWDGVRWVRVRVCD
ncbi:MAG: hypothetical protein JO245_03570 [Pseudolabrys sp.]|nr:hypothetical protein [Pseudolabrys sp.]